MSDNKTLNLLRELDNDDRVMSGAVMTTFSFSPSFFEQAVLPALKDKSVGDTIAVLADTKAYQATLEQTDDPQNHFDQLERRQPEYAGQRYHLAPVSAGSKRAFHPKIHYITGKRRVHATVSSANFTHAGLTNNREIATRLAVDVPRNETDEEHGTDASDEETDPGTSLDLGRREQAVICTEVADFIRSLIDSPFGRSIDSVTRNTIQQTLSAGNWLQDIEAPDSTDRSTHFLETLNQSLFDQIRGLISSHDEQIRRVDIAAPFYGTSLDVPQRFTDKGIETTVWLQNGRVQIPVTDLRSWLDSDLASAMSYEAGRYVHGKVLRITTDEADYCLSGSPNASRSAILSSASGGGNIEAALLRRVPSPGYFDCLFEAAPFSTAEELDLETFEADDRLGQFEDETAETPSGNDETASENVELHGVGYQRRESYDGGRLTVTGAVSEAVQNAIKNDETDPKLLVRSSGSDDEQATLNLRPNQFEWSDSESDRTDPLIRFTLSTDLYGKAAERPLIRTARAQLSCADWTSGSRWVQTHTPTTGEPTTADVENAGATTVPQALTELYEGDPSRQTKIIDSLNGLLGALRKVDDEDRETTTTGESQGSDSPSGGLHVRSWSQSSGKDAKSLIERFYSGWKSDLDDFISSATSDNYYFDEIETRLTAINATSLQLLLLDDARSDLDIPRQVILNTIKDVYSQQDIRGERGTSLLAEYCRYLRAKGNDSDENAAVVYNRLQTYVLPQIVLAAVIAETHIADDREAYFNQQDWAFEALVLQCFQPGYPEPDRLDSEWISDIATQILESIDGVRTRVKGSTRLKRYADRRYLDQKQLERAVLDILVRSTLLEGQRAVEAHQRESRYPEEAERILEDHTSYLPSSHRRRVEGLL